MSIKDVCEHHTIVKIVKAGNWVCALCQAEFVPLRQVQQDQRQLAYLRTALRNFLCTLNKDGSMNEKAFSRLCRLAAQCSCTHLPWWDHTRIDPMEG